MDSFKEGSHSIQQTYIGEVKCFIVTNSAGFLDSKWKTTRSEGLKVWVAEYM